MTEQTRAEGPAVVADGDPAAAKIIVLDPAGLGSHGELPATWRPLRAKRHILWCRLPTTGALTEADDLLGDDGSADPEVDVVAAGPCADAALQLAERHPRALRHILLVDPDPQAHQGAWLDEHEAQISALRQAGTQVQVIAESTGGERDRVPPPLPLGHPDVVAAVTKTLTDV